MSTAIIMVGARSTNANNMARMSDPAVMSQTLSATVRRETCSRQQPGVPGPAYGKGSSP